VGLVGWMWSPGEHGHLSMCLKEKGRLPSLEQAKYLAPSRHASVSGQTAACPAPAPDSRNGDSPPFASSFIEPTVSTMSTPSGKLHISTARVAHFAVRLSDWPSQQRWNTNI
jgi:hypothetical protein